MTVNEEMKKLTLELQTVKSDAKEAKETATEAKQTAAKSSHHKGEPSVTTASKFYNELVQSRRVDVAGKSGRELSATDFNIMLLQPMNPKSSDTLNKHINSWFDCKKDKNCPEAEVQQWFNDLDWKFWDTKPTFGRKFTTRPVDTHSSPLENGRKPDCSHIALGMTVSQYSLVSLNDLKSRGGSFNADDKGKVLDLSQAFFDCQSPLGRKSITSYLLDGDKIMFFLYQGASLPILESVPMEIRGIGGLWLLSLLSTPVETLGFRLPRITAEGKDIRVSGFLGSGNFNNAFIGSWNSEDVVVRQLKSMKDVDPIELDIHRKLIAEFKAHNKSKHIVNILAVSDCRTAMIQQPVCSPIAYPASTFALNKKQLLEVILIAQTVKDAGYVHLDLRPTNLLLNGKTVVLCDFGSAVKEGVNDGRPLSGTSKYASPGMLQHLLSLHPHIPSFDDDYHSVLRIIYVSLMRGAYEDLSAISVTDLDAISKFWHRAFAPRVWKVEHQQVSGSDYGRLRELVESLAPEEV